MRQQLHTLCHQLHHDTLKKINCVIPRESKIYLVIYLFCEKLHENSCTLHGMQPLRATFLTVLLTLPSVIMFCLSKAPYRLTSQAVRWEEYVAVSVLPK